MKVFKTISFETKDEATAKRALQAFADMNDNLSVEDMEALGNLSKEKPGWVGKAKPFLAQFKNQL